MGRIRAIQLFSVIFLIAFSVQKTNSQISFSDNAVSLGVDVTYGESFYGGGVSFADFDGDGWDDLSFTSKEGEDLYFFKNNNGSFSPITFTGVSNTNRTKQILWIDYDNDGDKDLFVTSMVGTNQFYRNDGSMTFTDISSTIGLFTNDMVTYGATFGDIDNDGDLDVFICNRDGDNMMEYNFLYRNDGGTYTDITVSAGIFLANELTFDATFFDYDNDGYQDIYVANDKSTTINRLYRNKGDDTFEDVSASSGAGINIDAMTTTIGDYDNDGDFDIYVTNTPADGNYLLRNNGDGTFTNVATATGTKMNSFAWGASWLDADCDGRLDLFVSSSMDGSVPSLLSSAFYHQQNDGNFLIPSNIGFQNDDAESYSNAIGDFNNDGRPDIAVSNDTHKNQIWENTSSNSNNWLKVKLEGVTSNKDGIGNVIEISANGSSQYRYTIAGEGYLAQNSSYEFFGIGNATIVDFVRVYWKATGQTETISNVAINQAITVQEGNGILSTPNEDLLNFSIYPNPSNTGIFHVNGSDSSELKVTVFDIQGKKLINHTLENDQIDLSYLASGIYVIQLKSNNGTFAQKVIKN